jgi:hypothetical protein
MDNLISNSCPRHLSYVSSFYFHKYHWFENTIKISQIKNVRHSKTSNLDEVTQINVTEPELHSEGWLQSLHTQYYSTQHFLSSNGISYNVFSKI